MSIQKRCQISVVDAGIGPLLQGACAVEGYSQTSGFDHFDIVGAITHGQHISRPKVALPAQSVESVQLRSAAEDRFMNLSAQSTFFEYKLIYLVIMKANASGYAAGEKRESVGNKYE